MGTVSSSLGSSSSGSTSTAANYFSGMSNYSQDLNNAIQREVQIAHVLCSGIHTPARHFDRRRVSRRPQDARNFL